MLCANTSGLNIHQCGLSFRHQTVQRVLQLHCCVVVFHPLWPSAHEESSPLSSAPPTACKNCIHSLNLQIGWLQYCVSQSRAMIEWLFIRAAGVWWLKRAELGPRASRVINRLFSMLIALVTLEIIAAIESPELPPPPVYLMASLKHRTDKHSMLTTFSMSWPCRTFKKVLSCLWTYLVPVVKDTIRVAAFRLQLKIIWFPVNLLLYWYVTITPTPI